MSTNKDMQIDKATFDLLREQKYPNTTILSNQEVADTANLIESLMQIAWPAYNQEDEDQTLEEQNQEVWKQILAQATKHEPENETDIPPYLLEKARKQYKIYQEARKILLNLHTKGGN